MRLKNYINFDDKAIDVLGTKIVSELNDIDKIFNQFDSFYKKGGYIFRGVNEAAYKMLSSSQRAWINNGFKLSYNDYLISELNITKAWNNGLIRKYLASINKKYENNDISYFSIMQHYGIPTPLLDFTYNPYAALYFACKNINNCYYDDNFNDLRNFFSIYFIYFEWLPCKNFTTKLSDIKFEDFLQDNVYQLENDELVYNNLNIIAQEGLFLINTSSELDLISLLKKKDTTGKQKFFPCYNIHKSLAVKIREKLTQIGITEEQLFPDFRKMKT